MSIHPLAFQTHPARLANLVTAPIFRAPSAVSVWTTEGSDGTIS